MDRRLRRSCSLVVAALLFAMLLPALPAAARPQRASRPIRASSAHPAAYRPLLTADDNFPGVPIPSSPFVDSLTEGDPGTDPAADMDDVFQVHLEAGQTLEVTLVGPGPDPDPEVDQPQFVLYLYPVEDWDSWVESSEGDDSGTAVYPQTISYTAGTSGRYYLDVWNLWGSGAYTLTWSISDPPIDMKRLAGPNRYATAIAVSEGAYAEGSSQNVILATGANFADALAASALAGSYDCPILLTYPTSLAPGVLAEIFRLKGAVQDTTVTIVGSNKAVSDSVAQALAVHTSIKVRRLGGADRYATAVEIGKEVYHNETAHLGRTWTGEAFIAKGVDFPDALAAAPIAFRRRMPILLVTPTAIPGSTSAAVSELGISHAYVLGSSAAVSTWVASHIGAPATRLEGAAGSGRMGTAVAIADHAVANGWATAGSVGITTGWNFPDALGGSVLIGKEGGVMLLTNPAHYILSDLPWGFVYDHRADVTAMRAFGSNATDDDGVPVAVGDAVFEDFLYAVTSP